MKWYGGQAARTFKLTHDVEHPENMTEGDLCKAMNHIRESYLSSPFAEELCKRAGNYDEWRVCQTRRRAVQKAAASFGFHVI